MKKMKALTALLLSLIMVMSLTACGNQTSENAAAGSEQQTTQAAQTVQEVQYPVTVTDQAGRSVTIEKEPEKLVSGYYISTSLLIALNQKDKLVGIEAKAKQRAIYSLSAPELVNLPSVGTAKEFDLEGCAALSPDLVILPLKLKSAVESLEALGIKVLLVNPEDQSLLTEMIELISTATNSVSRGQQLLDFYETQQNSLTQKLSGVSEPSVYLAGNSSLLSTAGEEMYQSSLISLAGGKNAASTIKDTYWATIDYEQLLAWNPEYIILASDADYSCEDVLSDPNLAECQAVVKGNVYQMPSTAEAWDSPVPSGILGAVWLANVLHPDKLSKDECNSLIEEYYETFYNFTYPQE